jgi:hypothetical protein
LDYLTKRDFTQRKKAGAMLKPLVSVRKHAVLYWPAYTFKLRAYPRKLQRIVSIFRLSLQGWSYPVQTEPQEKVLTNGGQPGQNLHWPHGLEAVHQPLGLFSEIQ